MDQEEFNKNSNRMLTYNRSGTGYPLCTGHHEATDQDQHGRTPEMKSKKKCILRFNLFVGFKDAVLGRCLRVLVSRLHYDYMINIIVLFSRNICTELNLFICFGDTVKSLESYFYFLFIVALQDINEILRIRLRYPV